MTLDTWLAIWGLLIGVLGLIAAYFFYIKSRKEPEPWYSIHPLRTHLVDTTQTEVQGLEVRHNGIIISDKNITATTMLFGNRGTAPIRSTDTLIPLNISMPGGTEMLDVRIIKTSRGICGFALSDLASDSAHVTLSFVIAERSDSVKIQIIHRGDPDAKVKVELPCPVFLSHL